MNAVEEVNMMEKSVKSLNKKKSRNKKHQQQQQQHSPTSEENNHSMGRTSITTEKLEKVVAETAVCKTKSQLNDNSDSVAEINGEDETLNSVMNGELNSDVKENGCIEVTKSKNKKSTSSYESGIRNGKANCTSSSTQQLQQQQHQQQSKSQSKKNNLNSNKSSARQMQSLTEVLDVNETEHYQQQDRSSKQHNNNSNENHENVNSRLTKKNNKKSKTKSTAKLTAAATTTTVTVELEPLDEEYNNVNISDNSNTSNSNDNEISKTSTTATVTLDTVSINVNLKEKNSSNSVKILNDDNQKNDDNGELENHMKLKEQISDSGGDSSLNLCCSNKLIDNDDNDDDDDGDNCRKADNNVDSNKTKAEHQNKNNNNNVENINISSNSNCSNHDNKFASKNSENNEAGNDCCKNSHITSSGSSSPSTSNNCCLDRNDEKIISPKEVESTSPVKTQAQSIKNSPQPSSSVTDKIDRSNIIIEYKEYESELQMQDIMRLIQTELSEPYSIYTYRYFIYNWPKLCFLAAHNNEYVGAIVCKLDMHMNVKRGYIAMLAVKKEYRKLRIGTNLVQKAIEAMLADNADEVVLETEMKNIPALRLYENLGFVRDKRLFRYYLNGVDALRLKLWFR